MLNRVPLAATALLPAALAGCGADVASPAIAAPTAEVAAAPPSRSSAQSPAAPVGAGFPPLDRPWIAADFAIAEDTLSRIAAKDPAALPRLTDPRTAPTFARIVALDNFDGFRDKKQPAAERMLGLERCVRAFTAVYRAYLDAGKDDDARWALYRRERFAFMVASQRTSLVTWEIVDELVAAYPPDQAKSPETRRKLDALAEQAGKQTNLVLNRFEDGEKAPEDLAWFARALKPDLAPLLGRLGAPARDAARKRLEKVAAAESDAAYKSALADLTRSLIAAR